jgi:sigma-B regulation protein RsbU (phosphoserine phosphatase)
VSDRTAALSAEFKYRVLLDITRKINRTFDLAAALAIEKAMAHRDAIEKQRMAHQLRMAREVQANLLPGAPPALQGYDVAAINIPTWDIGGDYYDYIPLSGGRLGVVIADVAGKGIPAALIMTSFRTALRGELRKEPAITPSRRIAPASTR